MRYTETMGQSTNAVVTPLRNRAPGRPPLRFRSCGASLGLTATQTPHLVSRIESGLPFKALESLAAQSGLTISVIAPVLGIPERTLARRKVAGKFSPHESERLWRVSTVFERAVELFEGDVAGAVKWLTTPQKALTRQTPLAYLRTELGAREVENLIGQLEYGVFA